MKVVDMHCDTIAAVHDLKKEGNNVHVACNHLQLDLEKMKKGDYALQNFALYTNLEKHERPFEYAMELVDTFYQELEAYPDQIGIVRSYADIEKNMQEGRMSALLTLEEGEECQGNLAYLRNFYRLGARMMTLTWNYENQLAYPNGVEVDGQGKKHTIPDTVHGLKERGIEFVQEMERLGMIIDISHLNDAGIWDVFKYTTKPFVASHSNARALASHPRNLTDDMIRALAERGGVMGINYYAFFLKDWEDPSKAESRVSDMVKHMKHIREIGGIGCIGLGSDFDGIDGTLEMKDCSYLPLLEAEMRKEGFTEDEIEAVFYKNVLRVYREVLR